jgi:anti-sigma factor RsiW
MNCTTCKSELPELLLDPGADSASKKHLQLRAHLATCLECSAEFAALQRTFDLLDAWEAPEPSAYFDQKLAVLLREEQAKPAAGWLERMRERLLFNTGRQFRPMLAGALALLVVVGGGTFAGITEFSRVSPPAPVTASAAVDDLQILDRNEQAIQQMDQLLQDDDNNDSNAAPAQPAS